MPSDRVPILFDTDIGSDIDDAVALSYLLREPRCELLGITTVTGEPRERARLASAVCLAAGREDVPIHAGIDVPLLVPQRQPEAPQKAVLERWPHRHDFEPYTAVPFLREAIRARAGEITLLAVGPFTNVAALFAADPEIPRLLKSLIVMGGVYSTTVAGAPRVEWNAGGDPQATAILFRAPVPELTAYGLDVTLLCTLPADECRARLRGAELDVVADMAEVWFKKQAQICFHDPLAAVGIFHPEVCKYVRGRVEVELASGRLGGLTHWTSDFQGPHRVAAEVLPNLFFKRYFRV
jgi:purine nucleosidase